MMMIVTAVLKVRQYTGFMFGGFEHVCALGYATEEAGKAGFIKFQYGGYVLVFGSIGLLVFAVCIVIDHLCNRLGLWDKLKQKWCDAPRLKKPVHYRRRRASR